MRNLEVNGLVVAALLALVVSGCGKDPTSAVSSGRDKTPKGLGVVCTKDADCKSGLTCHLNATDPTDDQLCAAACGTAADCQSQFADYTTCTGVHVCVVTCATDDDCVAGTICDSHGWCQRGGPDSGVQACVGTLAACSTVTTESDCVAARCTWSGTCAGTPTPCSTQTTADTCATLTGCTWYAASSKCDGTPTKCSYYQTQESCQTLGGGCPADCPALRTIDTCEAVSGCAWADAGSQCSGTPAATTCGGCDWTSSCIGTSAIASCQAAGVANCATTPGCQLVTQ